jgi:hypothetical protein
MKTLSLNQQTKAVLLLWTNLPTFERPSANIPHSDGIEACKEIWESRSIKDPPTDCLVTMLTNGVEAVSQTGMVCEDTRGSFTFLFFFVLK